MKQKKHKLLIMALVMAFSLAAVMCCCVPDTLHAAEEVASCHQSSESHEPAQEADECSCDDALAVLTDKVDVQFDLTSRFLIPLDHQASEIIPQVSFLAADYSPPLIIDTSPLYIKNAVLRL